MMIPKCETNGCNNNLRKGRKRGLCSTCGVKAWRAKKSHVKCSVPDCDKPFYEKGLCSLHFQRLKRNGHLGLKNWDYRYVTNHGYVDVLVPLGTPGTQSTGRMREHRYVMQCHLGRPLLPHPHEIVHHKNGIRHDNRIENLELWSDSHPPSQRVEDLVNWAKSFLIQYEPHSLASGPK